MQVGVMIKSTSDKTRLHSVRVSKSRPTSSYISRKPIRRKAFGNAFKLSAIFRALSKSTSAKTVDSGISLASEVLTDLLTTTSRSNTTDIQPLARRLLVIILCRRASEIGRNEGETKCRESASGQKLPTIRGGQRIFHDSSSDDLSKLLLQP